MAEPSGLTKADPRFNLTDVEPTNALGAITDEDYALERALARQHMDELPVGLDEGPVIEVKRERLIRELLSDALPETKPASTIAELMDQVHMAKELGCDSLEATPALVKHFCRKNYPEDVGYFHYHDIKVFIAGHFEKANKRDKETVERRLFGASKVDITPSQNFTADGKK